MHGAGVFDALQRLDRQRGCGEPDGFLEERFRIFTKTIETVSATEEICIAAVAKRAGGIHGVDGHPAYGIDRLLRLYYL
jgi:hypothetical protein